MTFTLALSGDTMITSRVSRFSNSRFLKLVSLFQHSDVAYTHLETLLHDYEGPEVYPAAEAGWGWMRSPRSIAHDLSWAGFDVVSLASNHSFDYMYGGLYSTWASLEAVGIPHAGTGRNLAEARSPVYLEASKATVALVSMTTSFPPSSRAGEARRDMKGRPGVNPLRYYYSVDEEMLESILVLTKKLGWWSTRAGDDEWIINPPGLHNTTHRFRKSGEIGISPVADEEDVEGNLQAIQEAKRQADLVLVHVHNHEWDPEVSLEAPPKFIPPFARLCIEAGADVFIAEGSHAPLRGVEVYKSKVIFYDPGDLFRMTDIITRWPADFYQLNKAAFNRTIWEAMPGEGIRALRSARSNIVNPPGGYMSGPVLGFVVPVCHFADDFALTHVVLVPGVWLMEPYSRRGLPVAATKSEAKKILTHLAKLSSPFGTRLEENNGQGIVKI